MPLVVKENESLDPLNISLLGAMAVMLGAYSLPDLIEQLGFLRRVVGMPSAEFVQCSPRCKKFADSQQLLIRRRRQLETRNKLWVSFIKLGMMASICEIIFQKSSLEFRSAWPFEGAPSVTDVLASYHRSITSPRM
jgi:hypothetical protein